MVVARAGAPEVEDVPPPTCRPGEVLVKTAYSVISTGTETWTIGATQPMGATDLAKDRQKLRKALSLVGDVFRNEGLPGVMDYARDVRNPRVPLGYSLSGVIVEVGRNIRDLAPGDRVSCAGEGKAVHAEYVAVPRNLVAKVPEKVPLSGAAFGTLGAIAMNGFRRSDAKIGESVLVIGVGLVGSLVVQIARAAGCKVTAMDLREERALFALGLGAGDAYSTKDPMVLQHAMALTAGKGFDHVIVCASAESSDPLNVAGLLVRDKGRVTVVGRVGMDIERKDYYQKELDLAMSRSLGPGRYDPSYEEDGGDYPFSHVRWTLNRNMGAFLELLEVGKIDVPALVGGSYDISKAVEAYDSLKTSGKVAVLLTYADTRDIRDEAKVVALQVRTVQGRIRTVVAGPGNYAKEILIPSLRSDSEYLLSWLVSSNPLHARQLGERYRFEKCTTDFAEALADSSVDIVFIATPNDLHYQMVLQAARSGKTVFVEKPLCLSEEELEEIKKTQNSSGARIIVGFNRRYAPLAKEMKAELSRLKGPRLITYRVNADFIPNSRWVQDPSKGGGRIIAECCHFFDFFNYLLGSGRPEVAATSVGVDGGSTVTRDNVVFSLKYRDGSVANLVYSSLGNRSYERERVEVFCEGEAMVIEDFRVLRVLGKRERQMTLPRVDKGHRAELTEIARALRGKENSLVSFDDAADAMTTTFAAERAARETPT
jgi:predicted dehydrogenase/NADPH:quinone reductase-like Zn-dependent oxidoreductase